MSILDPVVLKTVRKEGYHAYETHTGYNSQTEIYTTALAVAPSGKILEYKSIRNTVEPVLIMRRTYNKDGVLDGQVHIVHKIDGKETEKYERYENGQFKDSEPDRNFKVLFDRTLKTAKNRFNTRQQQKANHTVLQKFLSNFHSSLGRPFAPHRTPGRAYRQFMRKS